MTDAEPKDDQRISRLARLQRLDHIGIPDQSFVHFSWCCLDPDCLPEHESSILVPNDPNYIQCEAEVEDPVTRKPYTVFVVIMERVNALLEAELAAEGARKTRR